MEKLFKISQFLFLFLSIIALLILLKGFLIPVCFGLLIALIVYPVCRKLENIKIPRSAAIFISIFLVMIVFSCIVALFVLQIKVINAEIPQLIVKFSQFWTDAQKWMVANLGLSLIEQSNIISSTEKSLSSNLASIISGSFSIASETLFNLIIVPLYSVLLLFYRGKLINFIIFIFPESNKWTAILSETIHIYFNYIKGMLWVYLIVGILNSIGLLCLGVDYAILFGMTTAIMTIIPYIGIIISSILPITLVWLETDNIWYPIGVIAIFSVVQYFEATIIFPYIVGKQLGVNALVSIASILAGAAIWGGSGMILALPVVALLRIISGHVDSLKPVHRLLGVSD